MLHLVFFYENLTKILQRVEIGIFPVLTAYWSGFGIFKQSRDGFKSFFSAIIETDSGTS